MLFKKCFRLVQNRAIRESVNAKCTSHFGVHLYIFCHFLEKKSKNISVTKKPESSYIFTFYDGLRSVFHGILYNFFYFGDNVSSVNVCYFNFERKTKLRPANISFIRVFAILYFRSHVNKAGIYVRYKTHSNKALSTNNSSCTLSDRI